MELFVNSLIANLLFSFDVVRGVFVWGDNALLIGAAVAAGTYLGTRTALTHAGRPPARSRGGAHV